MHVCMCVYIYIAVSIGWMSLLWVSLHSEPCCFGFCIWATDFWENTLSKLLVFREAPMGTEVPEAHNFGAGDGPKARWLATGSSHRERP